MTPTIALLDLDAFFASVEQMLDPSLKGKPVIVCRVDPQGGRAFRGIVSTASYEARKFGVKSGMPVFQARKLAPKAYYVDGHYSTYAQISHQVFAIAAKYCPHVEVVSIDEGFLDFTDCLRIYKDIGQVCEKIRQEVSSQIGITASIGLASSRVVAKVASGVGKPDGLTIVPVGEEKQFLSTLYIRDLPGVGPRSEEKYLKMGVRTIGDLASLPQELIEKILGKFGVNLWLSANGISNVHFQTKGLQKGVSRSRTFESNSNDHYFLLGMLRFLVEKVASDLREHHFKGSLVYTVIRDKHFIARGRQRKLSFYTDHARDIYTVAEELFFELWDKVTTLRLIGIGVTSFEYEGFSPTQLNLFEQADLEENQLDAAVDRLRARHGFGTVISASAMKMIKKYNTEEKEQTFQAPD